MRQEKLEKEVEELGENYYGLESKYEEKKAELQKVREYIDVLILNDYNEGEIAQMYDLSEKQAEQVYNVIMSQYVRIWFKTGKFEIIKKDD